MPWPARPWLLAFLLPTILIEQGPDSLARAQGRWFTKIIPCYVGLKWPLGSRGRRRAQWIALDRVTRFVWTVDGHVLPKVTIEKPLEEAN